MWNRFFLDQDQPAPGFEGVYCVEDPAYVTCMDIRQDVQQAVNLELLEQFRPGGIALPLSTRTDQLDREAPE